MEFSRVALFVNKAALTLDITMKGTDIKPCIDVSADLDSYLILTQ